MVIEGRYALGGIPPERVFEALGDPAILARAVPGCRELIERGPGVYELAIDAGVGAIRGRYTGEVKVRERRPSELYEAELQASGSPGAVRARLRADLAARDGGTEIAYTMDATLSGPIAGIGQRVLAAASRKNATAFLEGLERELAGAGEPVAASASAPPVAAAPPAPAAADAPARAYPGAAAETGGTGVDAFQRGVILGFALSAATIVVARLAGIGRGRR